MTAPSLRLVRLWRTVGVLLILFVAYESLNRQPLEIPVGESNSLGHLLAYAVLMLWHSQFITRPDARIRAGVAFMAMGLALEVAQYFTGYRSFDLGDAAANATGVMIGWLCAPPRLPNFLAWFEGRLR